MYATVPIFWHKKTWVDEAKQVLVLRICDFNICKSILVIAEAGDDMLV